MEAEQNRARTEWNPNRIRASYWSGSILVGLYSVRPGKSVELSELSELFERFERFKHFKLLEHSEPFEPFELFELFEP